ncbi:MAG: hypothetical protein LQ343_003280 [Gyalolechia ehrenbergii]|nr:MAG: hypothetical protein LQ343_003280 [Gyalolechia ehrenbergii]
MELDNLSSNWKKLQATLKNNPSRPPKRKASEDALQPRHNGVKRIRITPIAPFKGIKETENGREKGTGTAPSNFKSSAPSASLALWAEDNDISAKDLAAAYGNSSSQLSLPDFRKEDKINEGLSATPGAGKYIAIDCEMVGVGPYDQSALARVSAVNYHGHQLYDSFVQTKEPVTHYRTFVSGITPQLLQGARTFETVQAEIAQLLDGKILIGHAIKNDMDALLLGHPKRDIRDTSKHPAYRRFAGGKTPGLKRLAKQVLGVDIQRGEHSSIEDARATMLLFRREKAGFEQEHQKRWGTTKKKQGSTSADKQHARASKRKRKAKK